MSAAGVTDVLCRAIEEREHDFILCNYANGDMVGPHRLLPRGDQGGGDGGRSAWRACSRRPSERARA